MLSAKTDRRAVEKLIRQMRSDPGLFALWERDAISTYVVPLLRALGWDTDNATQIEREFQIGMGRVDFLLKGSGSRTMPVEAKRPSQNLRDHERQILLYAFEEGMTFAALTNAHQWWLYRAMAAGNWKTRKFCAVDLLNDDVRTSSAKLEQFLRFNRFCSKTVDSASLEALRQFRRENPVPPEVEPEQRRPLRVRDIPTRKKTRRSGGAGLDQRTLVNAPASAKLDPTTSGDSLYPNPHAHGTKMRQVFEALRESWVTGDYLTDLTGQRGGWQKYVHKHYVESGRYGELALLWRKGERPSPMHLATAQEADDLLSDPEITIYPE